MANVYGTFMKHRLKTGAVQETRPSKVKRELEEPSLSLPATPLAKKPRTASSKPVKQAVSGSSRKVSSRPSAEAQVIGLSLSLYLD